MNVNLIHAGKNKCPNCGVVGKNAKENEIKFLRCPLCSTEFTNELILNQGDDIHIGNN